MKEMLRAINKHRNCENFQSQNVVRNFWKTFSILDCLGHIEAAWQEITETTLNRSWSKLLPEIVVNPRQPTEKSTPYQEIIQGVVNISREISGQGFEDVEESEILDLVLPGSEVLTVEEVVEIAAGNGDTDSDKKEERELDTFHSKSLIKIINLIQSGIDEAMSEDQNMTRCLRFKQHCDAALQVYEELYKDYVRSMKQSRITHFFKQ